MTSIYYHLSYHNVIYFSGNGIRHNGTHYRDVEDKSNQWFGASLYSSENGIIVVCIINIWFY